MDLHRRALYYLVLLVYNFNSRYRVVRAMLLPARINIGEPLSRQLPHTYYRPTCKYFTTSGRTVCYLI